MESNGEGNNPDLSKATEFNKSNPDVNPDLDKLKFKEDGYRSKQTSPDNEDSLFKQGIKKSFNEVKNNMSIDDIKFKEMKEDRLDKSKNDLQEPLEPIPLETNHPQGGYPDKSKISISKDKNPSDDNKE